jgi:hypothetical protein
VRANLRLIEQIANRVKADGGEVLSFASARLDAAFPSEKLRDASAIRLRAGIGSVGLLLAEQGETGLILHWSPRRG